MNDGFMFSQKEFDKYSDNGAFLTKVFTPLKMTVSAILFALSGVVMIILGNSYSGMIASHDNKSLYSEAEDAAGTILCNGLFVFGMIAFVIAVGAIISAFKASKAGKRRFTPLCPAVFLGGCVLTAGCCVWILTSEITAQLKLMELYSENIDYQYLFVHFGIILPYPFLLVMSFGGAAFFISVIRTVRGKGLFSSGANFFRMTAILTALAILAVAGFIIATELFVALNDKMSVDMNIYILAALAAAAVASPYICTALFVKQYRIALQSAERAIKMTGMNLYMGSDGEASSYYQSAYTSPEDEPDAAPVSAVSEASAQRFVTTDIPSSDGIYSADSIPGISMDEPAANEEK